MDDYCESIKLMEQFSVIICAIILFQFDKRVECEVKSEKVSLIFRTCELDDSAQYSCQILKFVKPGEQEQTDSCLLVEGLILILLLQ